MFKIINSIFFISCTSIGAGIIALPCLTIYNGFILSSLMFSLCYIFMTLSALIMMETTFWFKKSTNTISIINQILGYKWKIITYIIYLLLLYSLIIAYIIAYTKWIINNDAINKESLIISLLIYIVISYFVTFKKKVTY